MKVLLYAHSFAPNVGGAETLALLLARGLAERVGLTVVTRTPAGASDDARFPFPVLRRPGMRALWRLIRDADVVHLAGPVLGPLAMGYLQHKTVVVEHHGYQAACPNGLLLEQPSGAVCPGHFLARRYGACVRCRAASVGWRAAWRSVLLTFPRRWLARRVRANVAVSAHVAARLAVPNTTVILHGVPQPATARTSPGEGAAVTFGFVGRLVREKGVPVLLEAAAMLVRQGLACRVLIVGDGPGRARLERQAAQLGAPAEFAGTLEGPALEAAASHIDVAVMPSVWEETAGLAAMEAMRRGTPLIASAIGGLAEIVDGAGVLVEPGDAEALAAAMRELLLDPRRRAELGREARRRADAAFAVERMIEEHAALWARAATR